MKKYGVNYTNELGVEATSKKSDADYIAIEKQLEKLKEGYAKRDPKLAEAYLKELFIEDDSVYILGTSSDELCPGVAEVKDLLESDWEYWGDATFDVNKSIINYDQDIAWFAVPGTVKYNFEHNQKRYDGYVDFAKEKANDKKFSAGERIAFVNWAMALTYHQQEMNSRDYFCPMRLTGVMIKENDQWKISQGHFSMPKGVFADQRLENNQEFVDEYDADVKAFKECNTEGMKTEVSELIKTFATECVGNENVSSDHVEKYFSNHETAHIISPDTEWYVGETSILNFLKDSNHSELTLDTDSAITRTHGNKTWVTAIGTVKQIISQEALAESAVEALNEICSSEKTSQEKLYNLHRHVAYALKESSVGENFTCPIRFSAMITEKDGNSIFEHMHFSYPYYWIFEGKLDTI